MATTSLPKIAPRETPISSPPPQMRSSRPNSKLSTPPIAAAPTSLLKPTTLQNVSIPSVYEAFPPRLITSIDTTDFLKIPPKVNPLKPPPPERRTHMLETKEATQINQERSELMQMMHRSRYHTAYQKWSYGSPAEKEIYRRLVREGLKQQMADRQAWAKTNFESRVKESEMAVEKDRSDIQRDIMDHIRHHNDMKTFRDANKSLMEERWTRIKSLRHRRIQLERDLLKFDPFNWSKTLN